MLLQLIAVKTNQNPNKLVIINIPIVIKTYLPLNLNFHQKKKHVVI